MTGEAAAIKMQKERGYVVIGFPPPLEGEATIPSIQTEFASAELLFHKLVITGSTDRADWEAQVAAIFGAKSPVNKRHPPADGQRFFRCTLMEAPCVPSK
jgi:hypothetical protein